MREKATLEAKQTARDNKSEAKLFIEDVPEPEYFGQAPVRKEKKQRAPKVIAPKTVPSPVVVEQIRELVKAKEIKPAKEKIYESAFTYREDATRQQRPPAKYSNRKAIDDYEF